jgi:hypothetical protein
MGSLEGLERVHAKGPSPHGRHRNDESEGMCIVILRLSDYLISVRRVLGRDEETGV